MAQLFYRTNAAVNNGNTNVRGDRAAIIIVPTSVVLLNVTAQANPGGRLVDYDETTSNPIVGAQFTVGGDVYTIESFGSGQVTLEETITTPGGIPAGTYDVDPGDDILNHDTPIAQRNVITPRDLQVFATNNPAIGVTWRSADWTGTDIGMAIDDQTRQMQLQNIYLMFGPGVEVDLSGYTVDVFDNANIAGGNGSLNGRAAGIQFGGSPGSAVLDGTTNETSWLNKKARVRFNETRYNLIRNAAGNSGSAATGSFTMALNAELLFEGQNTFVTGGSGGPGVSPNTVNNHGIGMHPQAAAPAGTRAITQNATAGYPNGQGGQAAGGWHEWTVANLVGSGSLPLDTDRSRALLGVNEVNLPSITRSAPGDTLRITSPLSLFGADNNAAQLRSNVTGNFSEGVTFEPNELNAGGGNFNIITSSEGYVTQGNISFPSQMVFQGEQTTDGQIVVNPRQDAVVFDGFDFGDRTADDFSFQVGAPNNSGGSVHIFKRLSYQFSKPLSISDDDAPLGGITGYPGFFRAWVSNDTRQDADGLGPNNRYGNDTLLAVGDESNLMSDGTLRVLQNNLQNPDFGTAASFIFSTPNYPNLNRDNTTTPPGSAGNSMFFEGRYNNEIRIPYIFFNAAFRQDNTNTIPPAAALPVGVNLNSWHTVDDYIEIYVQYPYTPHVVTRTVADLDYVGTENISLDKPAYVSVDNPATVVGYLTITSAQQALDRRYFDYLEIINEANSIDVVMLRADIEDFLEIHGSTLDHYDTNDIVEFTYTGTNPVRLVSDILSQADINEGVPGEVGDPVENTILRTTAGSTVTGDFSSDLFIHNTGTGDPITLDGVITAPAVDTNNIILTGHGNAARYNNFEVGVHNIPTFRRSCTVNIVNYTGTGNIRLNELFGANFSIDSLTDATVITLNSDTAVNVEIATVDRNHFVAGTNVTFVAQTMDRVVIAPVAGIVCVENLITDEEIFGTTDGLVVTTEQRLTYSYALEDATTPVRIYYVPTDPDFYPSVYNSTLADFVLNAPERPEALFAESAVEDRPETFYNETTGHLFLRLFRITTDSDGEAVSFGDQPDNTQRYFLNAIGTQAFFDMLIDIYSNDARTDGAASFDTGFIDSGALGSTTIDGNRIRLTTEFQDDNLTELQDPNRGRIIVRDVTIEGLTGTLSQNQATVTTNFDIISFPTVGYTFSSQLSEAATRNLLEQQTDRIVENQETINTKVNRVSLSIPTSGDLPNTV